MPNQLNNKKLAEGEEDPETQVDDASSQGLQQLQPQKDAKTKTAPKQPRAEQEEFRDAGRGVRATESKKEARDIEVQATYGPEAKLAADDEESDVEPDIEEENEAASPIEESMGRQERAMRKTAEDEDDEV